MTFTLIITVWQLPVTYTVTGLVGTIWFTIVLLEKPEYNKNRKTTVSSIQPILLKTSILHQLHQIYLLLQCRYTIMIIFNILQFLSVNSPYLPYIKLRGQERESKVLHAAMNGKNKPQKTSGTAYNPQSLMNLGPHFKIQAGSKAYLNLFSCLPDYSLSGLISYLFTSCTQK